MSKWISNLVKMRIFNTNQRLMDMSRQVINSFIKIIFTLLFDFQSRKKTRRDYENRKSFPQ